ncbi:MAG: hypothetical protein M3Q19_07530 [Pseudomonadota bacterium]|nr:hypothetical protein [Pseudomonadota bacterium]
MTDIKESTKPASGSAKSTEPKGGGDPVQRAQQWGGGSKGSKGKVTAEDRANEQSSAKS